MTLQPVQRVDVDVAIVGSGFAGSLLALLLRQRGLRVALLERGTHPRFAIGESSTPLANLLLEEIADCYDLPRLRPFSKWGTWQATYPDVACGLKRGFSFFRHDLGQPFADTSARTRQLLVAASPHDGIGDTHWYRPDFDHWLVREAADAGAVVLDQLSLDAPQLRPSDVVLEGTRLGACVQVRAAMAVDASGPRGYLWRHLELGDDPMPWLPQTQGLYAHFTDVDRWDAHVANDETPPYPVDDAAVHHIVPGAWMWVLRFSNGVTSAGVAATPPRSAAWGLGANPDVAWQRVLGDYPTVRELFARARTAVPFVHAPRLAHRSARVAGPRWALLPSAAGVIDPLLSTGFPLTLLGILRLAGIIEQRAWTDTDALVQYERDTLDELRATEQLVAALYASMSDFSRFTALSLLYFAAASFTETVRRLGQASRARGFLLHADPDFGPRTRAICARVLAGDSEPLDAAVNEAVSPIDVAGLTDRRRRNWYPVLASDLHAARERLGVTAAQIDALLARCGFQPEVTA